jgi:transposase
VVNRAGNLNDYPLRVHLTADVAEDYRVIVLRDPNASNAQIAAQLGMKASTMIKTLARARATGLLDIRRISVGQRAEIARHGERNGVPAR